MGFRTSSCWSCSAGCCDPEGLLVSQKSGTMTKETEHDRAVIDALTAHVALLDELGGIIAVNDAWRQFADANGSRLPNYGDGLN